MTKATAEYWIERLGLQPHPEGGHFRETYRSGLVLPKAGLPGEFTGERSASTAIYFLLKQGEFSAFHKLRSDEIWHFYDGDCVAVHVIDLTATYRKTLLGRNPSRGQVPQAIVPAGCWFASAVEPASGRHKEEAFGLVGCTVAPGFDFEDFEMAERAALSERYPEHTRMIERFTRS